MTTAKPELAFTDPELAMLGKTADALTAYMGTAILAEVGETEGAQWVIFARALDQDEDVGEDIVRVQMGGPGTQVLGQRGGLEADKVAYDCAFLWAIEITPDHDERFVRLDPEGEVFDVAPELAMLLPFALEEPELPEDIDDDASNPNFEGVGHDANTSTKLDGIDGLDDLDPLNATKH
ncbi:hypothetical protein [Orrella daihaiensis]|uniref:UxaA family hydrolase n=1 Tax=Orrella daihaiensis TaxID=2782176 RepID=A0ABY4AM09_9BURK|nr:hypothetical protein [Orrella daihaiensis]UOD51312.1 UxaA family hydrolase [Orrella daihaiensis]